MKEMKGGRQFQQLGVEDLISNHRHKPSNNRLPNHLKELAISHIRRDFHDYGQRLRLKNYANIITSK